MTSQRLEKEKENADNQFSTNVFTAFYKYCNIICTSKRDS